MKYEKPAVVYLGSALALIQQQHKETEESFDGELCTINAYEADE
jgi:hypothetical protein